jgi:DNA-binding XRE family transcriptional regulator
MASVRNALRDVLRERQLAQMDLAELAGVPYATVRRVVRGNANLFLEDALRISRALQKPIDELFWMETSTE